MATETVASGHASATDEQIVNKEKSEAIEDMIASLANEDEVKHDKTVDADGGVTNPLSKTEGDETNGELGADEVQKPDDSPALTASVEDNLKHDKIEDVRTPEDDTKAEPAVVSIEKTDDPVSLEAHIEDNLKEEKEVIPASHATDDAAKSQPEEPSSTEPVVEETPQQPEKEPIETEYEKQSKTVDIPEASSETIEKSTNKAEVNTQTESEAELVKEAEILETSDQKEEKPETEPETVATEVQEKPQEPEKELEAEVVKEAGMLETSDRKEEKSEPEPVVVAREVQEKTQEPENESEAEAVKEAETLETSDQKEEKPEHEVVAPEVQEKIEELEKESQEKPQEAEKPTTFKTTVPITEVITIEETTRELSAEILKETNDSEAVPTETSKAEPVVPEVEENPKEPEKQSLEQKEDEQPNTIAIAEVPTSETIEAIEEKTSEPEVLNETNNYETKLTEAESAELEVTKVDENSSEPEKESFKQKEEELPKTVIPITATAGDTVEVQPPKGSDIEVVKEISNSETGAVPGEGEKPGDEVVVHQPIESDIEVVKETGTTTLEAVPAREETPEPVSTEVEEKPRELVEVAEDVGETKKEVETKQEIVLETTINEVISDDTINESISLKEEKTDNEDETSIAENTKQVSLNEEAQAAPENLAEPSPEVTEKVVEEDGKKESSFTDVIERVSKDKAGVLKIPEQDLKEEREYYVPTSVEEKVAIVADDDKKEPEAPESVQVFSRETEVEINKDEKQIEAKIAMTEDDGPAVENKKGGHTDTKVDAISSAVTEPVRETLASKFEEETNKTEVDNLENEQIEEPEKTEVQVPEEPTKESDATKTSSKDLPIETPAKPAQKQSHNIISKVKQSLVKARKAIIGKSPSSKNHSTEAKGDIQVK